MLARGQRVGCGRGQGAAPVASAPKSASASATAAARSAPDPASHARAHRSSPKRARSVATRRSYSARCGMSSGRPTPPAARLPFRACLRPPRPGRPWRPVAATCSRQWATRGKARRCQWRVRACCKPRRGKREVTLALRHPGQELDGKDHDTDRPARRQAHPLVQQRHRPRIVALQIGDATEDFHRKRPRVPSAALSATASSSNTCPRSRSP